MFPLALTALVIPSKEGNIRAYGSRVWATGWVRKGVR